MRVLYILSGTTIYGGATKSFLTLVEFLKNKGVELGVVCPDERGVWSVLQKKNINTFKVNYRFSTLPSIKNYKDLIKFLPRLILRKVINQKARKELYNIVKAFSPDIVHTNSSVIKIGYDVAYQLNIPHIFHIREYGDIDFGLNTSYISNIIKQGKSYSITITKSIARHKDIYNSPYNHVIYNGIVSKEKIRMREEKDDFFLFAGRIEPTKGLSDLIDAYAKYIELSKKRYKLLIAGGIQNQYREYYEEILNKLKTYDIEKYVEWIGERNDIEEYMYRATATIVPSKHEGFGRVMVEAMSNGSLVIARNSGGSKEQFDNGREYKGEEIGLSFNNNEELTNHLLQVSDKNQNNFNHTISLSQDTILLLYSENSYGSKVYNLYKIILDNYN